MNGKFNRKENLFITSDNNVFGVGYPIYDYTQYFWEVCAIIETHESKYGNVALDKALFLSKDKNTYHLNQIVQDAISRVTICYQNNRFTIVMATFATGVKQILLLNSRERKKMLFQYKRNIKAKLKTKRMNERIQRRLIKIRLKNN